MAIAKHLEKQRREVTCRGEVNFNVHTVTSSSTYQSLGVDNSWDFHLWKNDFKVVINWLKEDDLEFDILNVDPALANAIRRILIAEIPTVAIEHVYFVNNTSVIPDEMFAHRLGLIPLKIDPKLIDFKQNEDSATEKNTVIFELKINCSRTADDSLLNSKVCTSSLRWLSSGSNMPEETNCKFSKAQEFVADLYPKPVHEDILLAKLQAGQAIELEAHAVKGVGMIHAKWSPVSTAWYRLQPIARLKREIKGSQAKELHKLCPQMITLKQEGSNVIAQMNEARGNEHYLEKIRYLSDQAAWKDALELTKVKEHFIFTIQSTGIIPPAELFVQALDVLSQKCDNLLAKLA